MPSHTNAIALLACSAVAAVCQAQQPAAPPGPPDADWREAESGILDNHVQLTFADRFHKAGEAYFSPDETRIIFQAVETPEDGADAEPFYAMFVAELVRDDFDRIIAIDNVKRLSPPGSANTCGWFHPSEPGVVIFGSTVGPPSEGSRPGYQRDEGRYRWMFPPEMKIVRCAIDQADGRAATLERIHEDPGAYVAEGSLSRDGRHLLYCSLTSNQGDIFVKDLHTGTVTPLVTARGYDGGPFFSPDDQRICYRSDRRNDSYLQLLVAELVYDETGAITGIAREHQVTDDGAVNWAPYWHPDGRHLVYATSTIGHHNYEVFMIDADPGDLPGSTGTVRYGTRKRRITHAPGADVLPVFNGDGTITMWTSQRGDDGESQLWVADFVLDIDARQGHRAKE